MLQNEHMITEEENQEIIATVNQWLDENIEDGRGYTPERYLNFGTEFAIKKKTLERYPNNRLEIEWVLRYQYLLAFLQRFQEKALKDFGSDFTITAIGV
jgi:hypothetical protein